MYSPIALSGVDVEGFLQRQLQQHAQPQQPILPFLPGQLPLIASPNSKLEPWKGALTGLLPPSLSLLDASETIERGKLVELQLLQQNMLLFGMQPLPQSSTTDFLATIGITSTRNSGASAASNFSNGLNQFSLQACGLKQALPSSFGTTKVHGQENGRKRSRDKPKPRVKKVCTVKGCDTFAKCGGRCIRHGGGKRCTFGNCDRLARFAGSLCYAHGIKQRKKRIFEKMQSNEAHEGGLGGELDCVSNKRHATELR
jgi:hypothetical protein